MRFGIGGDFSKGKQSEFVLSKWSKNEQSELITLRALFYQIISNYATNGIVDTMNKFNSK